MEPSKPTIRVVTSFSNLLLNTRVSNTSPDRTQVSFVLPSRDPGLASSPSTAIGLAAMGIGLDETDNDNQSHNHHNTTGKMAGSTSKSSNPFKLGNTTSITSKGNKIREKEKKNKGFRSKLRRFFGRSDKGTTASSSTAAFPDVRDGGPGGGILVTREVTVTSEPVTSGMMLPRSNTVAAINHSNPTPWDDSITPWDENVPAVQEKENKEEEEEDSEEAARKKKEKEKQRRQSLGIIPRSASWAFTQIMR
ncbi:hypothetical protein GGR54DRAFT_638194 [Hypoxylon sp. NC1633]|nr:hypothetical protein GGR54DRAFT_638194 [Hypoxylon sp. NC1633]